MAIVRRGDVYVDTEELRALAERFHTWSTSLDKVVPLVGATQFTPGSVEYAHALALRYDSFVRKGYGGALAKLRDSLDQVSVQLALVARGYEDTENTTIDDVERLADTLAAVKKPFAAQEIPNPTPPR